MGTRRDKRRRDSAIRTTGGSLANAPVPAPVAPPSRGSPRAIAAVLVTFAAAFIALEVAAYTTKSATWDEPIHLTAGYAALAAGDYRVDPSHPPFLRMWAALPIFALHSPAVDTPAIDRAAIPEWLDEAYAFSHRFLYGENDADRLLYQARFMVVVWGVVLGILLFCWANEWLGFWPATLGLAFFAIEPNLAAHASLVTTDLGVTCFVFGAIYFLWRSTRGFTALNLAAVTVCFALAIVTKFSAIILAPTVLLLLGIAVSQRSGMTIGRAVQVAMLLAVGTFVAIWAIYGFRYAPSATDGWLLHVENTAVARQNAPELAKFVGWIDGYRLLPNAFTQGLLISLATVQPFSRYLAGMYSTSGWWYYFPIAFLIKTPVALLVLLFGGFAVFAKRWRYLGLVNEAFVVLPIVVFLGVAMASGVNIGLRHILPVYPFVLLIAVAGARRLVVSQGRGGAVVLAGLVAMWLVTFSRVYPNTLTFFNRLVGGPRNGFKYLTDSNLDWGQDLKPLKQWMDARGVPHVNLAYFGSADPAYYGIDCTYLPGSPFFATDSKPRLPGYVAISTTVLTGVYLPPRWRLFYRAFRNRTPNAVIGNSIRVYWVGTWPEAAEPPRGPGEASASEIDAHGRLADSLMRRQWFRHAIVHYRKYLKHRPEDVAALENLGKALTAIDALAEAIPPLRRAAELAPHDGMANRNLAFVLFDRGLVDEAHTHVRRAVELRPDDPDAHDLLGCTLALKGSLAEASRHFERALKLDPNHADARQHLNELQRDMRR